MLLYCIVLYCIVLYCIVLYCIVLYCIVLYCIVLYVMPCSWLFQCFSLVFMETVRKRMHNLYEFLALRCFNDRFDVRGDCMKRML